jgi:hypothetical protein
MVSHPTGTTVRAVNLFHALPVRKQTAGKDFTKVLGKVRALLNSYIIARPNVRISLKVPKSRSEKFNFTYAPANTGASVKDATMKLLGRDCANHCISSRHSEHGFEFELFHPRPTSDVFKISNIGHFISVDSRPVGARTGTLRDILTKYRKFIKQHDKAFSDVKDPFLCLNIICPDGSYDPNVEPLKNDVIFGDANAVLVIAEHCFSKLYPERQEDTSGNAVITGVGGAVADEVQDNLELGSQSFLLPATEAGLYSSTGESLMAEVNMDSNILDSFNSDQAKLSSLSKMLDSLKNSANTNHTHNKDLNPWAIAKMPAFNRPPVVDTPVLGYANHNDQLLTPILSSSPDRHARNPINGHTSPSSCQQNRLFGNHRVTDNLLGHDNVQFGAAPRGRRNNRDIRSMVPRQQRADAPLDGYGRLQRGSNRVQGASHKLYDDSPSSLPVVRTVSIPSTSFENQMHSGPDLNARFRAELLIADKNEEKTARSPPNATFRSHMPLQNFAETVPARVANTPFLYSTVEDLPTTNDGAMREKSSSCRHRSMSRARGGAETHNIYITNNDAIILIDREYDYLSDDDILPWMPLEEMPWMTVMPELCEEFALQWTPILCDLMHKKYPETREYLELETEVGQGLLQAQELEMD